MNISSLVQKLDSLLMLPRLAYRFSVNFEQLPRVKQNEQGTSTYRMQAHSVQLLFLTKSLLLLEESCPKQHCDNARERIREQLAGDF